MNKNKSKKSDEEALVKILYNEKWEIGTVNTTIYV
jgi:hypothetical protein